MNGCPDDGKQLISTPGAALTCPVCGGAYLSVEEIEAAAPSLHAELTLETRAESGAFARTRRCPACNAAMVPFRLGPLEAWVERCPSCELYWFERQDRHSLQMLARRRAMQSAVAGMSEVERQELARDLAAAHEATPELSPMHAGLAMLGLPVVTRTEGARTPALTWALAVALAAVFIYGHGNPDFIAQMGFHSDAPSALAALTANFAHFGWLHLLGNIYFLVAFGDGVEQKMPRPLMLGAFVLGGALAIATEGLLSARPTLTAGASAGVAVVMGACFVLQPRARVVTRVAGAVLQVPIWAFAVLEIGFQLLMVFLQVGGVAWVAHLAGLALGIMLGVSLRGLRSPAR